MNTKRAQQIEADRSLIVAHGGPARLAEKLEYDKYGGVQRIQNWLTRGIPASVKLERPDLFLFPPAAANEPGGQTANPPHAPSGAETGVANG